MTTKATDNDPFLHVPEGERGVPVFHNPGCPASRREVFQSSTHPDIEVTRCQDCGAQMSRHLKTGDTGATTKEIDARAQARAQARQQELERAA